MTSNQIRFAELQEAKRHNLALESKEFGLLAETQRHNQAYESETAKHNRSVESINWYDTQSSAALRSTQGIQALGMLEVQREQAAAATSQASSRAKEIPARYMSAASDIVKSIAGAISPFAKLFG